MMQSIALYRIIQEHVGKMNRIGVQLYKEEITKEEAAERAEETIEDTMESLNPAPAGPDA